MEAFGESLGPFERPLEPSLALLEPQWRYNDESYKSKKTIVFSMIFSFPGLVWKRLGGLLDNFGSFLRHLRPSWGPLGRHPVPRGAFMEATWQHGKPPWPS